MSYELPDPQRDEDELVPSCSPAKSGPVQIAATGSGFVVPEDCSCPSPHYDCPSEPCCAADECCCDRAEERPAATVSRADVIRSLRAEGLTLAAICERLGVAKSVVNRALYSKVREYEKTYNRERYYTATCERCGKPCTHNVHAKHGVRGRWCQECYRVARKECLAA